MRHQAQAALRWSNRRPATIHREQHAGDEARGITRQPHGGFGDVFRGTEAIHGMTAGEVRAILFRDGFPEQRRFYKAWADRVYANA